ncbi:putative disease resistance RPP13-like protein 3 [Triticum urartu]|uniref:putative disease resistance RPP13-like protein 3 n=1 Tax=Triticum urartu TaxID=4572 RepID=UPI002044A2E3|nr:putative disease resistance RPP13-like protein 3 [Triticum urartu]XP_048566782.1 putative disease resistance RPP13-like protein 3 [Triticum urartu]
MASASITFVLNRLGELAVKEAALLSGVGDHIRLLRDKLEWLQTFIQDADQERRDGANQYVGLWVRQTRDVAHEVEDVLDDFLRRVDLSTLRQGVPAWRRWLDLAASCTTQVSVRHDLSGRMEGIKERLMEISENVDKYNIRTLRPSASGASSSAHNSTINTVPAWDEGNEVVGFKDERAELQRYLLAGDDTSRSVMSLVGESGTGKSTLAWEVYDSPIIRKHFDVRAWINVPPQIRDDDILYFIYKRLCPESEACEQKNSITEKVHKALSLYLKNKRYLVMLDGLVNFSNWHSILHSLPQKEKGSRVMVITRLDDKEAAYANPKVSTLKIGKLDEKDSSALFCRRVFGANNQFKEKIFGSKISEPNAQMEKACENMFKITHGLPLAIVVLAGLLRTKSISEWEEVLKKLESNNEPKQVKMILALSFDDLPSRLKSCFLYFAGMPENLIYNARRLVRLWAAEGFLKPKKGKTMEDIGQNYLKELISREMIRLVKRDMNGGVWLVAIHDRLHAFAQAEAHEASFLEAHDNADLLAPGAVRRLHLQNYTETYIPMGTAFPKMRSILGDFAEERSQNGKRSLSSKVRAHGQLKKQGNNSDLRYHALRFLPASKFLRVIDLRGLRIKKVPGAIGDMIHVRYLGLRSRSLTKLPSSIARLINLQTLDIKRTEVKKVAQAFWEIPTLRHVVANMLGLPKSAGVLNNMQTLTGLLCSDPLGKDIKPLENMVYLRNLHISGLDKPHWEALREVFKKLESLMYMHLAGKDIPFELFTNFTLRRLQILELLGEIDTSRVKEEDQYTLPNVTRLVLKLSLADQKFIDKIGELPSLMELVLSEDSCREENLLFSDKGFNNVTSLVMANLTRVKKWTIRPRSIPKIQKIVLSGCPKMEIKLEGKEGEESLQGLMADLKEVVVCNMLQEGSIIVKPANSAFEEKINHVAIKTKSEDITDATQRDGRWRAGMIAGNMYQN